MWKSNIHVCHQAEKLLKYFNANGSLATETKLVWNLTMNINRLHTLPINKEEREIEWDNIGRIAMNNGFPKESIKKLRKKLEQKRIGTNDKKQEKQKWTPFTYFSPLVRKVTNIFKDTDIKIAYISTNTIFKQLAKKPDRPDNPSGIYSIRCITCNNEYVGQSG